MRAQLSTSKLLATEDLETQWGAVAQGRKTEGVETVIHVALVESSRVLVHIPILEQCISVGTAYKDGNQPILGDREVGRQARRREEGEKEEMKPRDYPTGRAGLTEEERVIIDMSM